MHVISTLRKKHRSKKDGDIKIRITFERRIFVAFARQ